MSMMSGIRETAFSISREGVVEDLGAAPRCKPKSASGVLEILLESPLQFVSATERTTEDERKMTLTRPHSKFENRTHPLHKHDSKTLTAISDLQLSPELAAPVVSSSGFYNHGVMCYRNSTLQALLHVPQVMKWLRDHQSNGHQAQRCAICSFQRLSLVYWGKAYGSNNSNQNLRQFEALLRKSSTFSKWRWNRQQDANEFYLYLINAMLEGHTSSRKSLENLLGHQTARTTICRMCGHESRVLSPYEYRLGVVVKHDQALNDILRSNTFSRIPVHDYRCEKCRQRSTALQHSRLTAIPKVLELDFLRFQRAGYGLYKKNSRTVPFSQELDLSAFVDIDGPAKYQLASVVQHVGSFETGHYRCIAKGLNGRWEVLDDSSVKTVGVSTAIRPEGNWTPYSLFFTRVEANEQALLSAEDTARNTAVLSKTLPFDPKIKVTTNGNRPWTQGGSQGKRLKTSS